MATIRRAQRSVSPEAGRQAARRQRLTVEGGSGAGGGGGRGAGGGVRLLSRDSFLVADADTDADADAAAADDAPASPAREDSPLLGSKKPSRTSFAGERSEEKKQANVNWGDVEGITPVSDYGSDTGSRRTTVSAAPTTLSAADEALLGTFMEVLSEGLPIKIHRSSKRPRKTTLWLKDTDTLVWASKRAIGPRQWHKLHLGGVKSVQAGKGGSDSLIIGSGESADENACFSLTFPKVSIGFEAASELERDALVQGFAMLVEDIKAAADEERYRDAEGGVVRDI
eukprot:g7677.t2